jgi:hypothetical protein
LLQSRDFSRGRRDASIASPQYQFFSSPRDRFFHRCDIDFFIAAISIFHCRDIDFFVAAISIFSSPRYQFFHRCDIDFFITAILIFSLPQHQFFFVAILIFCPITAIFIRPYSRAAIRHCSSIFAPTGALIDYHRAPTGALQEFLCRRALLFHFCADGRALQSLSHADGCCSSIFVPMGALCNHYHSALTGAALQFLCCRALNSSIPPPSGVTFKHCAAVGQKF